MKKERRRKRFWKIEFKLKFLNFSLLIAIILNLFIFYMLTNIMTELADSLALQRRIIVILLSLSVMVGVFLVALLVILHRSLGAIPRIEETLKRVIEGDRSLRITTRKNDILHSFVKTLNDLLDLIESKCT